jgi:hypothetical protein
MHFFEFAKKELLAYRTSKKHFFSDSSYYITKEEENSISGHYK